jgi:hypothetical protein
MKKKEKKSKIIGTEETKTWTAGWSIQDCDDKEGKSKLHFLCSFSLINILIIKYYYIHNNNYKKEMSIYIEKTAIFIEYGIRGGIEWWISEYCSQKYSGFFLVI